jgi:hypothetical protein
LTWLLPPHFTLRNRPTIGSSDPCLILAKDLQSANTFMVQYLRNPLEFLMLEIIPIIPVEFVSRFF